MIPADADPHAQDKELVERCLAGDPGAWEELVGRFQPLLKRHLSAVASKRGIPLRPEDADDLVSKVWESLLQDDKRLLRRYQAGASLDQWILTIAFYRLLSWVETRRREWRGLQAACHAEVPSDLVADLPEASARREEARERLLAA